MNDGELIGRTILCETARLRVIAQMTGSSTVFITFNELGLLKTGDFFWGHEFFARERISSIGIVTTEPNWYPPDEMAEAISVISRAVGGRRVVTYGHSQGGYGAIKFSAALDAVAAVAFCPQWSIDPQAVESFDRRYCAHFRPAWGGGLPIERDDCAGRAYVLYDPFELVDLQHVDAIGARADVARVPVPLSAHETVRLVTESGSSSDFIRLFCADELPSAAQVRRIMRRARRRSRTYSNNLLAALARKSKVQHRMFARAVASLPLQSTAVARLVLSLHAGDNAAGARHLRHCSEDDLLRFGAVRLWRLFRDASFAAGELYLAEILPRCFPDDAFLRLHAVNSLVEGRMFERARRELLHVIADTDWSPHREHVRIFAKRINAELG